MEEIRHDTRILQGCMSVAGWIRCKKRPVTVTATFAARGGVLDTIEGQVQYRVGDALVTSNQGDQWPVPRAIFLRRYTPQCNQAPGEDGPYMRRLESMRARQLTDAETVSIEGGKITGRAGDWLIEDASGSRWIVGRRQFAQDYLAV